MKAIFLSFVEVYSLLTYHQGAFTYDVRFLGRWVGQGGQAASDFTK